MTALMANGVDAANDHLNNVADWDDHELLDACIANDQTAWRELVRRYDKSLRGVIYATLEPYREQLQSDYRDDVMGAFWLKAVDNDKRALRCFDWNAGKALFKWFSFLVAQCAIDYVRIELDRPAFVPVEDAHEVADGGGVLSTDRRPFRGSLSARVRHANEKLALAEKNAERKARKKRRAVKRSSVTRPK